MHRHLITPTDEVTDVRVRVRSIVGIMTFHRGLQYVQYSYSTVDYDDIIRSSHPQAEPRTILKGTVRELIWVYSEVPEALKKQNDVILLSS